MGSPDPIRKHKSQRVSRVINKMRTALVEPEEKVNKKSVSKTKSRKGSHLSDKGKKSKSSKKLADETSSSGSGFVRPAPLSSSVVPNEIILSEESETDDMFNDPEGDEILAGIDLDKCLDGGESTTSGLLSTNMPKRASGKGKGRGKDKRQISEFPLKKIVTKTCLDKIPKRKGKAGKGNTRAKNKVSIVLSDSGSSTD